MDPNTGVNQDPNAGSNNGVTSFSPDIDMSAINEAVAAQSNAPVQQNSFDVNDISLDNTPTTETDLQKQLSDNPNMNLANSQDMAATPAQEAAPAPAPAADPVSALVPEATPAETTVSEHASAIDSIPIETSVRTDGSDDPTTLSDPNATQDPSISQAPDARPPQGATAETAKLDPKVSLEQSKSKLPSYILIGLAIIAVVSVSIAVVVSLG